MEKITATETPYAATYKHEPVKNEIHVPKLNIPSNDSTPRESAATPPYKPLLDHDYVMYESPLLKGIDWNAPTPVDSPTESPHTTSQATTAADQKQANLSQLAATFDKTSIVKTTEKPKLAPATLKTDFIDNIKHRRSVNFEEENYAPRHQFANEEVDDWRETLGDIHREAFDRTTEFIWENFVFEFTSDEVTNAILYLLQHELVTIYNDFDLGSIKTFLTPYILDAVSALAAAQWNPNTFNEVCANYLSNSIEDMNEEDYIRIDIEEFLSKVYDLLLTRMMYRHTSCVIKTIPKSEQLNDQYCKNLFDLYMVYDGNKPRPIAKLNNSYDHQAVFTSSIVTVFASKMARLSVPHDVYMSILVFLCYSE